MSHVRRIAAAALVMVSMAGSAAAQERRQAPPEIRTLFTEFQAAVNSSKAEEFEAMAKKHFTEGLLAKRNTDERRKLFEEIRREFGNITFESVQRSGPDAPLEANVKGSNGKAGVILITLDGFKIASLDVEAAKTPEESASSPSVPIHARMTVDELARALDGHVSKLAAADRFSGVVLVAKDGKPVFEKAYGYADRASRVANTAATRFNLGSINKIFTQVAIAQLAEQEKLAYAAPLSRFITDYPQEATRTATIEQLLTHRAGIADFFGPVFTAAPKQTFRRNDDYYALVSNQAPLFRPGERSQYCNGCYITLGEVVERVSGVSYEDYVREHIWKPAGMTNTGYPMADAIEPNVAEGYIRDGSGFRSNIYTRGAAGSAAGGGYSTAADMLAFDNALREGRLVGAAGTDRLVGGPRQGPRAMGDIGIAGGAPGINAILESNGVWTVVVMSNLDPPSASSLGIAIASALR